VLHISPQKSVLVVDVFLNCLGSGFLALHGQCDVNALFRATSTPAASLLVNRTGLRRLAEELKQEGG